MADDSDYAELKGELEYLQELHLEGALEEWESKFVEKTVVFFEKGYSLFPETVARIEDLFDKYKALE